MYLGRLASTPHLEVKKIVLIFNVKNYAKFWTFLTMYAPEMYPLFPPPFQISKYATEPYCFADFYLRFFYYLPSHINPFWSPNTYILANTWCILYCIKCVIDLFLCFNLFFWFSFVIVQFICYVLCILCSVFNWLCGLMRSELTEWMVSFLSCEAACLLWLRSWRRASPRSLNNIPREMSLNVTNRADYRFVNDRQVRHYLLDIIIHHHDKQ